MVSTNYRDFGKQLVSERARVDEAHRRRRAPHPAHQVPRRAVRQPLATTTSTTARRRSRRPTAPPRAPPRSARWCCSRTTAHAAVQRGQEDGGHRSARPVDCSDTRTSRRPATTCSARGGASAATRTRVTPVDGIKAASPGATYTRRLHALAQRALRPGGRVPDGRRRRRHRGRERRRPGRRRRRRDARDERRGRGPHATSGCPASRSRSSRPSRRPASRSRSCCSTAGRWCCRTS